jgi:hypothetical protein
VYVIGISGLFRGQEFSDFQKCDDEDLRIKSFIQILRGYWKYQISKVRVKNARSRRVKGNDLKSKRFGR